MRPDVVNQAVHAAVEPSRRQQQRQRNHDVAQPQLTPPHGAAQQLEAKPARQGIGTHLQGPRQRTAGDSTTQRDTEQQDNFSGVQGAGGCGM